MTKTFPCVQIVILNRWMRNFLSCRKTRWAGITTHSNDKLLIYGKRQKKPGNCFSLLSNKIIACSIMLELVRRVAHIGQSLSHYRFYRSDVKYFLRNILYSKTMSIDQHTIAMIIYSIIVVVPINPIQRWWCYL